MSVLERPQPRPGVLKIQAYVPGKSSAPGVAKVFKLSSNETPLGAEPEGDRGLQGGRRCIWRIIRTARRPSCARRSARAYGLDPARIVCGAGSDELLNLLARAYLRTATRRSTPRTAFWSIRSRRSAPARRRWSRPRRITPPTSMRSSREVSRAHQDRVPGEPEQSDRHLHPVRRGEAPARGPAEARAAGDRCGLRRIRAAQRLRSPASSWSRPPRTS